MSEEDNRLEEEKVYQKEFKETISVSETFSIEKVYAAARSTLETASAFHNIASEIVTRAASRGSLSAEDATILSKTLNEWKDYDERTERILQEQANAKNLKAIEETDQEVKRYVREVLKQEELRKATLSAIYNSLNLASSKDEETCLFAEKSHEELLSLFKLWMEKQKDSLFGTITQGLKDCGVDIVFEASLPDFKFGMQIKSNGDILDSNFPKTLKAQITDSRKYSLKGLVVILCGDLSNKKVREKVRGIIAELNQLTDNYVKTVSPEKAISLIKTVQ